MRYNGYIMVSNSLLKALGFRIINGEINQYDDVCPKKFSLYYVHKSHSLSALPMSMGIYMESQMIGASRNDTLDDLPRLKNGNKSVAHKRIDEHVASFQSLCDKYNAIVIPENVQIPITCAYKRIYGNGIMLTGVTDIITTIYDAEKAIIDIKFTGVNLQKDAWITKDVRTNDRAWTRQDELTTTQAVMYQYIMSHTTLPLLKKFWKYHGSPEYEIISEKFINGVKKHGISFYWWIFSSAKYHDIKEQQLQLKHVEMHGQFQVLEHLIDQAVERYLLWEKNGWPEIKYESECRDCPLKENCISYNKY